MAQYLLSVWGTHSDSPTGPYDSEEEMFEAFARVAAFNEQLSDEGRLVFVGGLTPPESAICVDGRGDQPVVRHGLLGQAPAMGGLWIVEADTDAEAEDLGARASAACGNEVEVRALQGE